MPVTVRIPAALRGEAGGLSRLDLTAPEGTTLAALLDEIGVGWPLLERRIRDEHGVLRRYVNLYVDGEECRLLDGMATRVADRAEVLVVPSVAGGQ